MKSKKVLIVEDEGLIVLQYKIELEDRGFKNILTATSGAKALHLFVNEEPDLVILDIKISGEMSGFDVAKGIRKSSNVPIIFVSGNLIDSDSEIVNTIKPVALFNKPVEFDDLTNTILNNL